MLFGADGALWKRRLGHGLVKFGPGLKGGSPAASRVFLSEFGENFVRGFSNHLAAANLAKALAQLGLPSRLLLPRQCLGRENGATTGQAPPGPRKRVGRFAISTVRRLHSSIWPSVSSVS